MQSIDRLQQSGEYALLADLRRPSSHSRLVTLLGLERPAIYAVFVKTAAEFRFRNSALLRVHDPLSQGPMIEGKVEPCRSGQYFCGYY